MVDPNRKINRLTDKDIEFLEECEREFGLRYTEDDAKFMAHCSKPLDDPPIVENWNTNDFSGNRNPRHNNKWRGGGRDNQFHRRAAFKGFQNSYPPVNMRNQYSSFVAASKDD